MSDTPSTPKIRGRPSKKRAASPTTLHEEEVSTGTQSATVAPPSSARAKRVKKDTTTAAAADTTTASVPPTPSKTPSKRGRPSAVASSTATSASSSNLPTPLSCATFYCTDKNETGEVFAFGSGDCSQLGLGADESMRERKKPTLITALTDKKISAVSIAAGSLHNLVLDRHHAIYSWGCNDDHALGRETDEWLPEPVTGPLGLGDRKGGIEVVQIACGASHSLALTIEGDVYCFGTFRDANGVIGFSETMEAATEPMQMTFSGTKHKVVMIAAGEHHDLALTDKGEVFQWGDIGIGRRFSDRKKKTKLTPSRVVFKKMGDTPAPKHIQKIFAGGHSSWALDENGVAWCWGPNNYNQMGLKNKDKDDLMILIPTPVISLPPLQSLACNTHHTLFLTRSGDVYSCGRGEDGRLGHGDMKNYEEPTKIEELSKLPHGDKPNFVNCGECHSLVVTEQGRLYSFGYGDLLQLGNGVEEDVGEPEVVTCKELDTAGSAGFGRRVVQAVGGAQHSLLLACSRTKKAPWADDAPAATSTKAKASASPKKITSLASLLPVGGWECSTCMVQNDDKLTKCRACETPRDGSAAADTGSVFVGAAMFSNTTGGAAASTGGFSFGAPAAAAATTSSSAPVTSAFSAPTSGGFSFGAAPATTTTTDVSAPVTGGFTFGGAAPATGGFTFGAAAPTTDSDSAMKD